MRFDEGRKRLFIDFVKKLDSNTISDISSQLLRNPIYCLPAVYMHLLAGDLIHGTETLVHISSEETEAMSDNNNTSAEDSALCSLVDVVWDMICSHPDFSVQSHALRDLLNNFPVGDRVFKSKKLCALAPLLLISKPEMLSGLSSVDTLKLLEKWEPDPAAHGLLVSQEAIQVPFFLV